MPRDVLIPVDGSDQSLGAVVYAVRSFPAGSFTTLHVIDTGREWLGGPWVEGPWAERALEMADACHERAQRVADAYDVELESTTVPGIPHKQVLEYAGDHALDLVVLGSHGEAPGTESTYLGRVAETVAVRSTTTVTVVSETADELGRRDLPGHVLIPIDGSGPSLAALTYTWRHFTDAQITGLHVVEEAVEFAPDAPEGTYIDEHISKRKREAEELLATAEQTIEGGFHKAVTFGKPTTKILEYAVENGCDQIIMGGKGRSGIGRAMLGSVAEGMLRRAELPVTIVREPSISAPRSP